MNAVASIGVLGEETPKKGTAAMSTVGRQDEL